MSAFEDHKAEIQKLADKHAKYLKLAFLAAIVQLRKSIDNNALIEAINSGSINSILRVINPSQLDELLYGIGMPKDNLIFNDENMRVFHLAATAAFYQLLPDIQRRWNYNPINERTVSTLISDASRVASDLVATTNAGVMLNISQNLAYNTNLTARIEDIKQLIGLTSPQAQAVLNFKSQLENRKVLGFTKPTDRMLNETDRILLGNHMKNGGLTQSGIDRMVRKYSEQLLNQRASEIALASAMNSINSGMQSMWSQGVTTGALGSNNRKFWVTAGDKKVRPTHIVIPGMNPNGVVIDSMFITPTGPVPYPMWGMGDYMNCRCHVILKTV
jgi:hypothetical protein